MADGYDRRAFVVEDVESYDPASGPPENGMDYLRSVIIERRQQPKIYLANLEASTKRPTVLALFSHLLEQNKASVPAPEGLAPDNSWEMDCISNFEQDRELVIEKIAVTGLDVMSLMREALAEEEESEKTQTKKRKRMKKNKAAREGKVPDYDFEAELEQFKHLAGIEEVECADTDEYYEMQHQDSLEDTHLSVPVVQEDPTSDFAEVSVEVGQADAISAKKAELLEQWFPDTENTQGDNVAVKPRQRKRRKISKGGLPPCADEPAWRALCYGTDTKPPVIPTLELVKQMDPVSVGTILGYYVSWLGDDIVLPEVMWLYHLLLRIEEPILRETVSNLRDLRWKCSVARSKLSCCEDPLLQPLNTIITLITKFFNVFEG